MKTFGPGRSLLKRYDTIEVNIYRDATASLI